MIFALSPQAKGRVERMAGTFQDRLVTDLRLVGATTIQEANVVLKDFVVRFNRRFGVPADEPDVAYRPIDSEMCMDSVLCFKHRRRVARDNTVRYRWRTLQLLPGKDRPSHAGVAVDVLDLISSQCSTIDALYPPRRLRPIPVSFAASTDALQTRTCHLSIATASAGDGPKCWRPLIGSGNERLGLLTMVQSPMASPGRPGTSPAHGGNPRLFRLPGGRRYRRQSAGACPSAVSQGHWVSTEARPRSMPKPRVRRWLGLEFHLKPLDLITW